MGDGRYYTPAQFFSIIFFTILLIYIVIEVMLCIYKGSRNNKVVFFLQVAFGMAVFCRFIEEIVYKPKDIVVFNFLSNLFLCGYIFISILIYIRLIMKKKIRKPIFIFTIFIFLLALLFCSFGGLWKYIMYILFAIQFSILSTRLLPYRISTSIFGSVKDFILDYVFIVDEYGFIIYKSTRVIKSDFFNEKKQIDIENTDSVFIGEVTKRDAYGKTFIKIQTDKTTYFQYNIRDLAKENKVVGYVITFIDITELVDMLDELKRKQEVTVLANEELKKYKDVVYEMEKEKEINTILSEIANNQYKSMLSLKGEIDIARADMEGEFDKKLTEIIADAKKDLQDVRRAVTAYMNYYEQE